MFSFTFYTGTFGQEVTVTGTENNVLIESVNLQIEGNIIEQTSPLGNDNLLPPDVPVLIESVLLENDRRLFSTTRFPVVQNAHPAIGTDLIGPGRLAIVNITKPNTHHTSPDFLSDLEEVVSTPDLRSYWDIGAQPTIPEGEIFVDLMYPNQIPNSGFIMFTERDGNSAVDFLALGRDGQPIEGANRVKIRGYQWNTGILHPTSPTVNSTQAQWLVVFSPSVFESPEPIYGFSIINIDGPDGKLIFFANSITATPDYAGPIDGEAGSNAVINILDNDEFNGFALDPIDVDLSVIEPFPDNTVILNPDGTIDVPPNTAAGIYTLIYQITAISDGESDQAEVVVEVVEFGPEAFDDNASMEDNRGADNILNVLDNDLLNGAPALLENVILSELENNTEGILTLNEDGSVDVSPGAAKGVYTLTYQICDAADPGKCDSAVVTIFIDSITAKTVDLKISKTSFGLEIYEGNEFEYEIKVENAGTTDAENVTIVDNLPSGLSYIGFTSSSSGNPIHVTVSVDGNVVTWSVPDFPAGETLILLLKVGASETGAIVNQAEVIPSPEEEESTPEDNIARDSNQILPFFIPNVITPGTRDNRNDRFEIKGINRFVANRIVIFNRWGDHVFEADDYQNDWAADGLNAGSYFYVLVVTDTGGAEQTYKGWIQVIK